MGFFAHNFALACAAIALRIRMNIIAKLAIITAPISITPTWKKPCNSSHQFRISVLYEARATKPPAIAPAINVGIDINPTAIAPTTPAKLASITMPAFTGSGNFVHKPVQNDTVDCKTVKISSLKVYKA